MMESFGIIGFAKDKKTIRPVVKATDFKVEFGIKTTPAVGRIRGFVCSGLKIFSEPFFYF